MAPYLYLKHAAAAFSPTNHALLFGQLECLLVVAQVEVHRELFAIHPGHCSWPRCLLEQTGGWAAARTSHISGRIPAVCVRSQRLLDATFPRILHLAGFACISLPFVRADECDWDAGRDRAWTQERRREREGEREREAQERDAWFIGINQEGREEEGLWRDYSTCQSRSH